MSNATNTQASKVPEVRNLPPILAIVTKTNISSSQSIQKNAPEGLERNLPESIHPTGDEGKTTAGGQTHALNGGQDSIVPEAIQKVCFMMMIDQMQVLMNDVRLSPSRLSVRSPTLSTTPVTRTKRVALSDPIELDVVIMTT